MKTIMILGAAAMLIASPALAGKFQNNETASSMNHINTADPDNPIYDSPTTSTSAADANANFKGLRPFSQYQEQPVVYQEPAYGYSDPRYDPRYDDPRYAPRY